MGRKSVGKILLWIGMIILFHTAFEAKKFAQELRREHRPLTHLPWNTMLELGASLLVSFLGVLLWSGHLLDIRASEEMASKTLEEVHARPSFLTFQHRKSPETRAVASKAKLR